MVRHRRTDGQKNWYIKVGATHESSIIFSQLWSPSEKPVKCVHFSSSAEFYHKSYHKVTWLSPFLGFFSKPSDLPRFSACSNLVSKSIQTTTLFIIYKILKMMLIRVELKFLNHQLNDNRNFPPKKIIAKSKCIFYGSVQATSFSCKSY